MTRNFAEIDQNKKWSDPSKKSHMKRTCLEVWNEKRRAEPDRSGLAALSFVRDRFFSFRSAGIGDDSLWLWIASGEKGLDFREEGSGSSCRGNEEVIKIHLSIKVTKALSVGASFKHLINLGGYF